MGDTGSLRGGPAGSEARHERLSTREPAKKPRLANDNTKRKSSYEKERSQTSVAIINKRWADTLCTL